MFDGLTDRFGEIFDRLKKRGALSESDVTAAMREIRVALLEADVALSVVKDFIDGVRERAIGEEVLRSVTPGQQVVKIVNDYLTEMLGPESGEFEIRAAAPAAVMMVGLQGSGKTTTSAKIAKRIQEKQFKKVLMASLDVRRPAAQQQLEVLGTQAKVATLEIVPFQTPRMIADRAMDTARKEGYEVVILDTAGRLHVDDELMAVGQVFLPRTDFGAQETCRTIVETEVLRMGYYIYGWRHVPVNVTCLGEKANATRPEIEQILVSNSKGVDEETFERELYVIRRRIEKYPCPCPLAYGFGLASGTSR